MSPPDSAARRVWLDVPYDEKDEAKAAGARWDPQTRSWYAQGPELTQLSQWSRLPDLLPGEDRQFGSGLFVDLIPASCWFTNVRSCVESRDWDRLRRMVYQRAEQRCEACGGQREPNVKVWLEAHERWAYDEVRGVQTLKRLVCLCSRCHEATHFGRAQVMGDDQRALAHLMLVNRWSRRDARDHVDRAFALWDRRNRRDWELDLTLLTGAGITLAGPPPAADRRDVADEALNTARSQQPAAEHSAALPQPGWYIDPTGRFEHRWWDGTDWTQHVANAGRTFSDSR
jgi:hypothetical protein